MEQGNEAVNEMLLGAALSMQDEPGEMYAGIAILNHLKESEKNFPKRFAHHTAIKDSSIALASFTPEEKRQMIASSQILQVFVQASLYRFEIENDFSFFEDLMNEQIHFRKNLSLGTGKLLDALRTSMKIVDVGRGNQQEETKKKGFLSWRR